MATDTHTGYVDQDVPDTEVWYHDDPDDVDEDYEGSRYQRNPRAGGPRPLADDPVDESAVNNRADRRRTARARSAGVEDRSPGMMAAGWTIIGVGAAAVLYVFAGPFVAVATAATGVAVWVGRKLARAGAAARARRAASDPYGTRGRRMRGGGAGLSGMLANRRARKAAKAGRKNLLGGAKTPKGPRLGGGGGRRAGAAGPKLGGGSKGGAGGRKAGGGNLLGRLGGKGKTAAARSGGVGPKGSSTPKKGGLLGRKGGGGLLGRKGAAGTGAKGAGVTPKKGGLLGRKGGGGGLLGRKGGGGGLLGRKGAAGTGAKGAGVTPKGRGTGPRVPRSLAKLMPGVHGKKVRAASKLAKTRGPGGGTGRSSGPGRAGAAGVPRTTGGIRRALRKGTMPGFPKLGGPAGRKLARKIKKGQAATPGTPGAATSGTPGKKGRGRKGAGGASSSGIPAAPMTMRQMWGQRRQRIRKQRLAKRAAQQHWYRTTFWPTWGRRLKTAAKHATWTPARYATVVPAKAVARKLKLRKRGKKLLRKSEKYLLKRPNKFLRKRAWQPAAGWTRGKLAARRRHRTIVKRWKRIYRNPARRAATAAWMRQHLIPQWVRDLRQLAASKGRWAAALGMFALMWAGIVHGFGKAREWAWDGRKAGKHHAGGRHPLDEQAVNAEHVHERPPGRVRPEVIERVLNPHPERPAPAGVPPTATAPGAARHRRPDPAPAPAAATTPTSGGNTVPTATHVPAATHSAGDQLQIPGGLHPTQGALLADAVQLQGLFRPRSFPDLTVYLASYPDAMIEEKNKWVILGDRLHATFPGFNLVQELAARIATGYVHLAGVADHVFDGYRALHSADFARFLDARVNEVWADVRRWGGTPGDAPSLAKGGMMHGAWTLWLTSCDFNLLGFHPENAEQEDIWAELVWWLDGLPHLFASRARYARHMITLLPGEFPIEDGVTDVMFQTARAFADLADYAGELSTGFRKRNPHDAKRREQPKRHEEKRDAGNTEMSYT